MLETTMTSSMPELTTTSVLDSTINNNNNKMITNIVGDEITITSPVNEIKNVLNNNTAISTSTTADLSETIIQTNVEEIKHKKVKGVRFEGIQDTLPRSRSYSGRTTDDAKITTTTKTTRSSSNKSTNSKRKSHSEDYLNQNPCTSKDDGNMLDDDSDTSSICSTCSSSSSSTDDHLYRLPQRRHYGGVRVSYVPNDALACARKRKQQSVVGDKDSKNCIIS